MKQITHNIPLNETEFDNRLIEYQSEGLNFTLSRTNYTASIKFEAEKIKYFASIEGTSFKTLGLIQKVKSHLKNNPLVADLPNYTPERINYFKYNGSIYNFKIDTGSIHYIENVTEVDITAAYVTAFLNKGLINRELFNSIIALPKQDRLKVLGAIATNKAVTEYLNGKPGKTTFVNDKELRNAWFYAVQLVDGLMNQIYMDIRQHALFYYVDGVYFKTDRDRERRIIDFIKGNGYGFKIKYFEKIAILNTGKVLQVAIPTESRVKYFTVPERKLITYSIQ